MLAFKRQPDASILPVIGALAALLALAMTAAIALHGIGEFQRRAERISNTDNVINRITEIELQVGEAQSAVRGFVIAENENFLQPFKHARQILPQRFRSLKAQVADNPAQGQAIVLLEGLVNDGFSIDDSLVELRRSDGAGAAITLVASGEGEAVARRVRAQADTMIASERKLLGQRETLAAASALRARTLIVLGALIGAVLFGATFILLRRENRRRRAGDRALLAANDALRQRAVELEESNQELESFSYSISHDLRIPLRAVSGYARMLEEDYAERFDSEGRRLLAVIRDNGRRMGALIDDLLAFSRLGRQAMQAEPVDMQTLVDSVVDQVRRKDDYPNSHLQIGQLPACHGDRALLQQVWVNLISNALKYSGKAAQPQINISGHETGFETIYVVADNGVGFDMTYYEKLFGVFQRLHSAEDFPGTGVGLAITQRIVKRHRGRLWAESTVDVGSTFFFALPRHEAEHG